MLEDIPLNINPGRVTEYNQTIFIYSEDYYHHKITGIIYIRRHLCYVYI